MTGRFNSGDCLLQDSKILDSAKSFASFAHDLVTALKRARLKQMQSGNKGQLTTWMKTKMCITAYLTLQEAPSVGFL